MARSGINQARVQHARDCLLAQGKHPSIDAIRVALGNTGSKTTISAMLKEITRDEKESHPVDSHLDRLASPLLRVVLELAERLQADVEGSVAAIRKACAESEQALKQRVIHLISKNEESESKIALLEAQARGERRQIESYQDELRQSNDRLIEANAKIQEDTVLLRSRQGQIEDHEASLRLAQESLQHIRGQSEKATEILLQRHEHELRNYISQISSLNLTLAEKHECIVDLTRDNSRLQEELSRRRMETSTLKQQLETLQQHSDQLKMLYAQAVGQKELLLEQYQTVQNQANLSIRKF